MNTTICKSTTTSIASTPYFSYYKSDWTWIKTLSSQNFAHKFSSLPSFYNIYVAAKVDNGIDHFIPTSVIPYKDYPGGNISVNMIDINNISVFNGCDVDIYVMVEALDVATNQIT